MLQKKSATTLLWFVGTEMLEHEHDENRGQQEASLFGAEYAKL